MYNQCGCCRKYDEYICTKILPTFPTFTELLSNGVLGLEIDPHSKTTEDGQDLYVYHIATYDENSSYSIITDIFNESGRYFVYVQNHQDGEDLLDTAW